MSNSKFPPLSSGSDGPLEMDGWDRCVLGGDVLPGKWRVTRGHIKLKTKKKSKDGADGARSTSHGLDPQEYELEGWMWTDEQLEAWGVICGRLMPAKVAKPKTGASVPYYLAAKAPAVTQDAQIGDAFLPRFAEDGGAVPYFIAAPAQNGGLPGSPPARAKSAGTGRKPVSFDHPQIRHFGMAILVTVVGVGILKHEGGHVTVPVMLEHWMPPSKGNAVFSQTRPVRNTRLESSPATNYVTSNPLPTEQPIWSPPNLTEG